MHIKYVPIIFLLSFHAGCKARSGVAPGSSSALQSGDRSLGEKPTLQILTGLMAPPGSASRIRAGEIMGQVISQKMEAYYQTNPTALRDPYFSRGLRYTLDYLATPASSLTPDGKVCAAAERIRVYRGYAGQPLLRPSSGGVTGVHIMKGLGRQLSSAFSSFKVRGWLGDDFLRANTALPPGQPGWIEGRAAGEIIYSNLALLYDQEKLNAPPTLEEAAQNARFEMYDWAKSTVGFSWMNPAANHTLGQQYTTGPDLSANSYFISTTLSSHISKGFGEGGIIVADLCPERAFLTQITDTIDELELLVPFFLLPEEITRVENHDCTFPVDTLAKLRCEEDHNAEYQEPLPEACNAYKPAMAYCANLRKNLDVSRGETVNAVSGRLTQCFHTPFEIPAVPEFNEALNGGNKDFEFDRRYVSTRTYLAHAKAFNQAWLEAPTPARLRQHLTDSNLCSKNCAIMAVQKKAVMERAEAARQSVKQDLEGAEVFARSGDSAWEQRSRQRAAIGVKVAAYLDGIAQKVPICPEGALPGN